MMNQSADSIRQQLPLAGRQLAARDSAAAGYANRLLESLGAIVAKTPLDFIAAQKLWARSGAMMLTGLADGSPLSCPAPLAVCMQGACDALQTLAPIPFELDAAPLLGERAAIAGHRRQGKISPGGSCRLLSASDGHVALNLARDDDWSLLPALLDGNDYANWFDVATSIRQHSVDSLCEKSRLLGLALTSLQGETCSRNWFEITATGPKRAATRKPPLVVDLSSLWAGPLCSHLLQKAGARVIKVESTSRPDGARRGPADFFHLLNAGKQCVAFDLNTSLGINQLRTLLQHADITIEASRPRALQQLGINAEDLVGSNIGLTWVSITGYGRAPEQAMRIAYGDDAGVAAGLSALLHQQWGELVFCGDAIADPLTGAHAALAALASWSSGGGFLLDVALQPVVKNCIDAGLIPCGEIKQHDDQWILQLDQQQIPVMPPRARAVGNRAHALGEDTAAICREFALPC